MGYNKIPLALGFNDSTGNASGLVEFTLNLSDVGDTCSDEPGIGQALVYNADGAWCPSTLPAPGEFTGNLSDVGQVCSAAPETGQALVWSGSEWCPSTIQTGGGGGGGITSISDAGDVTITEPVADRELLAYDDATSDWINQTTTELGIMQLDPYFTANDEGAVAQWDGTKLEVSFPDQLYMLVEAGEEITKGDVVYVAGDAGNGRFIVAKANASDPNKMPAVGLAPAAITTGANGKIVSFGRAIGLNTAGMTAGKPVYVATTAGGITKDKPTGPTHLIQNIGIVSEVDATNGIIKVTGVGRSNDIPNNLDVVGSVTVGDTVISQTNAILSNADQNSVMITDGASAVSSLSGASGSIVYFENDPPRPGLETIANILSDGGYTIQSGDTYVTDDGSVPVTGPFTINSTLEVTGTLDVTGDATFAAGSVTATPTAANHIANKSYVDSQVLTPSYFLALASGSHSIADETSAAIGWSTTGTGAITDPTSSIQTDQSPSPSASIIDINETGIYQIDCTIRGDGGGGRLGLTIDIHIDPNDGVFTANTIHQSAQYVARGATGEGINIGSVHMNTLISLSAGDRIAFFVKVLSFVATSTILQDGTYLRITKVG